MKYISYFLAILDFLTCIHMTFLLEMFVFDILHIFFLLLFLSLIISGILLIWKARKGIVLNFIQFPFRIFFAIYSFWFISKFFTESNTEPKQFFIAATILEFVRIISEIIIHRKLKPKKIIAE